jgi:hypothetical protein
MIGTQPTADIADLEGNLSVPVGKDLAIAVVLPILRTAAADK